MERFFFFSFSPGGVGFKHLCLVDCVGFLFRLTCTRSMFCATAGGGLKAKGKDPVRLADSDAFGVGIGPGFKEMLYRYT